MIKKVFVGLTITLILAIGVFGLVSTSYAQEEPETSEAVEVPEPETLENAYMYQNGAQNADADAIQTQNRTRLFESQEGECDESCDPQQLREQIGANNAGTMNRAGLGDGECDGTCDGVPQQLRYNDGTNTQNNAQSQQNLAAGTGDCDGTGVPQGRGQGKNGN